MKTKFYPHIIATCICSLFFFTGFTQVNLPYTLNFTANDAANWSDGIAQDGDGGTSNINGIDFQIYAANAGGSTLFPGATMLWHNNSYYSSNTPTYTGITPGPDLTVTMNGIPSMVLKSTNTANNFSLTGITMYDWGGWPSINIATYNNGSLVGSVNVNFPNANAKTITQANELTPAIFQNIDEIRFTPVGASEFWLSFNNISLAAATVLPITLSSFTTTLQADGSALLQWITEQEQNSHHFEIEQSTDGISYTKVGELAAKGNSSVPTAYRFVCSNPPAGKVFYRLKELDNDNKVSYSQVETVTVGDKIKLLYYPNPVNNVVKIFAGGAIIRQVKLYNSLGSLVITAAPNAANATINLAALEKAIYFMDVITGKETFRRTIYKN